MKRAQPSKAEGPGADSRQLQLGNGGDDPHRGPIGNQDAELARLGVAACGSTIGIERLYVLNVAPWQTRQRRHARLGRDFDVPHVVVLVAGRTALCAYVDKLADDMQRIDGPGWRVYARYSPPDMEPSAIALKQG